ncbi:MAG: MaoC family dehydratase [Bifidobacteriaceae bacterium]|jgi:acyl dehydratase|nr:MaoC family dehydratase [Bifidobacteriaceae bacterium]
MSVPKFSVGDVIAAPTRPITLRRAGWYSIALMTAAAGEMKPVQKNIHTSEEVAASQGLPGPIADGMHTTNWISKLLTQAFGHHYFERGSLRTKYIKITPIGEPLSCKLKVTAVEAVPTGIKYTMDVWSEDSQGVKLTVGDASVVVSES